QGGGGLNAMPLIVPRSQESGPFALVSGPVLLSVALSDEGCLIRVDNISPLLTNSAEMQSLSETVAAAVFRTDLSLPGFALIDLGASLTAAEFRSLLIALTEGLRAAYQRTFGRPLVYLSLGRFDQQVSTEAHLDGGPDESILILGYEPTEVISRLFLL